MKKVLGVVLSLGLLVSLAGCSSQQSAAPASKPAETAAAEPLKVGRVDYAAHGTKAFANAFAVVQGDKIVKAYVDEYQFMAKTGNTGVPNSDKDFGTAGYKDPNQVLASKRTNVAAYSKNMAEKGGSTQAWDKNMEAIQKFAEGKTIAELEKVLTDNKDAAKYPKDIVSGSTLTDTQGYLKAILEAAKAAK